jgi:hypothetical protein
MEGIQERLRGGICVIVLQKREGKIMGEGGGMTEDLASAYFLIDKGILTVRKVKEPKGNFNPNGCIYGFSIFDKGANIGNIRQVKLCPKCGSKPGGKVWDKSSGGYVVCPQCDGLGYVDK